MKLYDLDHSPFSARVRVAIDVKRLPIAIVSPPGGARSAAFAAINPQGLVPALALDDGTVIPESEAILEYLEDRFPDPPLRPASLEARARVRVLARIADLYLADALKQLFEETKRDPDPAAVAHWRAPVEVALGHIERHLDSGPFAVGDRMSTADCGLPPLLDFVRRSAALFPGGDPFGPHPKLAAYVASIGRVPAVARVLASLEHSQRRRAAARAAGRPED